MKLVLMLLVWRLLYFFLNAVIVVAPHHHLRVNSDRIRRGDTVRKKEHAS